MNRRFTGIAGKIVGVLMLIRLFMIPNTSSMTIGVVTQAALFLSIGIFAVFINSFKKKFRIFIGIGFLALLVFAGFLAIYGNRSTATFDEDVVIVLGARVIGERVSSHLARRLNVAIYYFERNPNAYIIVCGGLGDMAVITEAEAMARYLHERGVPRERIFLEDLSTSTLENLTFAHEILNEHFPRGFRAVVVSSDFHMFRAVRAARSIGMNVNHLGAPTPTHLLTENYLREMLAVVNFYLRTPKFLVFVIMTSLVLFGVVLLARAFEFTFFGNIRGLDSRISSGHLRYATLIEVMGEPLARETIVTGTGTELTMLRYNGIHFTATGDQIRSFEITGEQFRLGGRSRIGVGSTRQQVERDMGRRVRANAFTKVCSCSQFRSGVISRNIFFELHAQSVIFVFDENDTVIQMRFGERVGNRGRLHGIQHV